MYSQLGFESACIPFYPGGGQCCHCGLIEMQCTGNTLYLEKLPCGIQLRTPEVGLTFILPGLCLGDGLTFWPLGGKVSSNVMASLLPLISLSFEMLSCT